ncbi:hypothetical protein OCU04_003424 [Sclerotinia nivalis]|uniref:Uncharacterized protein n=1 Tax=Sclerotinia nivalis TaxID=352851 RepID=A0A9X0ARZ7_9HELO|nr:hypothetical protein OCU04_003424 [Sclerotinia nivalis]
MADNNSTLVILLEQVLSNELKNQIVIVEPPTDSTNAFAAFVQTLKNRHLYLIKPTNSGRSLIVPLLYIIIQNLNPVNRILTLSPNPTIRSVTLITIIPVEDPMDFNSQRCTNRHEQGECFHCRSTDHCVKDYPFPDNHPIQARANLTSFALLSSIPSSVQIQLYAMSLYSLFLSGFSSSGNGTRLV